VRQENRLELASDQRASRRVRQVGTKGPTPNRIVERTKALLGMSARPLYSETADGTDA
jgi:hypothetical protein